MGEVSKDAVFRFFNGKEYERINFKTKASLVDEDITHRFVTEDEKSNWNKKADTNEASVNMKGLMSAQDKLKLNNIADNANAYIHPNNSGNKHIPKGGSAGQILKWSSDGVAQWGVEPVVTQLQNGLMSALDKKKLDGIQSDANAYVHPSNSGNKHIPKGGSAGQILKWSSDGVAQWGPYPIASPDQSGLITSADKKKLDGMEKTIEQKIMQLVLDKFYPVGSIYMSTKKDNPANTMGGVWDRWGLGKVPVGVNESEAEFQTSEKKGGSKAEFARAWIGPYNNSPNAVCYGLQDPVKGQKGTYGITGSSWEREDSIKWINHSTTVSDINGNAISKLQPYITCYMWKRIK